MRASVLKDVEMKYLFVENNLKSCLNDFLCLTFKWMCVGLQGVLLYKGSFEVHLPKISQHTATVNRTGRGRGKTSLPES